MGILLLRELINKIFGRKQLVEREAPPLFPDKRANPEVIIIDGTELAVIGDELQVSSFLEKLPQDDHGTAFDIQKVLNNNAVYNGASLANAVIETGSQLGRWVKLTEESARQVQVSGLLNTQVEGVKYLATGEFGALDPWLKAESGSFFSNPAVLASTATLVAQMAMSSELAAMKELLQTIDQKLDAIARHSRDVQLAKLDRVTFAIQDAKIRADAQGGVVNAITWSQIQGESAVLDEAQGIAIRSIESILDSSRGASIKELGKLSSKIGQESSVWISVLGRTLELREELAILEISRTSTLKADEAFNHRASVRKALDERRRIIASAVERFSQELQELTPLAYEAVVLHANASRKLVNGLNLAHQVTYELGKILGKDLSGETLEPIPWVRAALDKEQRKAAVRQVVNPLVEAAKDTAVVAKEKYEEIREEIKKRDK